MANKIIAITKLILLAAPSILKFLMSSLLLAEK